MDMVIGILYCLVRLNLGSNFVKLLNYDFCYCQLTFSVTLGESYGFQISELLLVRFRCQSRCDEEGDCAADRVLRKTRVVLTIPVIVDRVFGVGECESVAGVGDQSKIQMNVDRKISGQRDTVVVFAEQKGRGEKRGREVAARAIEFTSVSFNDRTTHCTRIDDINDHLFATTRLYSNYLPYIHSFISTTARYLTYSGRLTPAHPHSPESS